jgi:hypothetical protein
MKKRGFDFTEGKSKPLIGNFLPEKKNLFRNPKKRSATRSFKASAP